MAVGKTLVTGATGFVGSHLARELSARGDELRLLIRSQNPAAGLEGLDHERVNGDVTDRRAVRRAMKGVDRVFNVAGITSFRARDRARLHDVNVNGARIVFEEALEAGVKRVVHTSSVAAIGPGSQRRPADENTPYPLGGLGIPYVHAKHEAEVEGLRLAARGLPIVFVNPTYNLGPDAPSGSSMSLVRRFLLRRIPVYTDGGINIVDVRDVATGHLLADEKGAVGERYILGGRNFTLQRLFADLSRISGVDPPPVKLPGALVAGGARMVEALGLPLQASSDEAVSAAQWWTYRNAKAKRELGFSPRPHEETLEDAVRWQREQLGPRVGREGPAYEAPLRAAASLVGTGRRMLGL